MLLLHNSGQSQGVFFYLLNYKNKSTRFYACRKFIEILCLVVDSTLNVDSKQPHFHHLLGITNIEFKYHETECVK